MRSAPRITVVGLANIDLVARVGRVPRDAFVAVVVSVLRGLERRAQPSLPPAAEIGTILAR